MAVKRAPKQRITDVKIIEGSLVEEGDNPEAHIAMFKSTDDEDEGVDENTTTKAEMITMPTPVKTTSQILAERRFNEEFREVRWAFEDAVSGIMYQAPTAMIGALLEKATSEFQAELDMLLANVVKVSPSIGESVKATLATMQEATKQEPKVAHKAIVDALETIGAIGADKKKETAKMEPKTLAELMAVLPAGHQEIVKAALEAAGKTVSDEIAAKAANDAKEVEALKSRLAKLEDERLDAEFKAKAESIPGVDVEKTKLILKSAFGRSKEEGEALEQTLRALGEQAKRGVSMKSIGSDTGVESTSGDNAEEKLKSIAAELRKADPNLTEAQAFHKAFKSNRELAAQAMSR